MNNHRLLVAAALSLSHMAYANGGQLPSVPQAPTRTPKPPRTDRGAWTGDGTPPTQETRQQRRARERAERTR